MSQVLSDRELTAILGHCIVDGDEHCVRANSYELRLGSSVRFHSTSEDMGLKAGQYLAIQPGELVSVSSLESLDFTRKVVSEYFDSDALMGLITPTTTMVREGFLLQSTKVDPGFRGTLNWGIRNSTHKAIVLAYGERMFKLTILRLTGGEVPERVYGDHADDHYQNSSGVVSSKRQIPADIPMRNVVRSTEQKLDPRQHLREAGYPFNHISTELTELHGKWEIVSTDVRVLKAEFEKLEGRLSNKIAEETKSLLDRIGEVSSTLLTRVEGLITERDHRLVGLLAAIAGFAYAGYNAILAGQPSQIHVFVGSGAGVLALAWMLFSRSRR